MANFWIILKREDRDKLKALMPKGWRPPASDERGVIPEPHYPSAEEVERTMTRPPEHPKRVT